ncbi:MAG: hypothetical protein LBJ63_02165 [Prevotellaceae bacterium]|jgi:hypothetical protein|nr:hypothetical protein [Prevotellaceae bacterium]
MNGRVILKLRKPVKDNPQHLYFENYQALYYDYSLQKTVNQSGEVRSNTQAGNIRIALPMLPTDELLSWIFDSTKKWNGEITLDDMEEESIEKVYFEEGRCVGFRLHYEPAGSESGIVLLLTVNVQRMIIGNVEYENPW